MGDFLFDLTKYIERESISNNGELSMGCRASRFCCQFVVVGLGVWAMTGCIGGGGSSSDSDTTNTVVGQFFDSEVQGLRYQRYSSSGDPTGSGTTDGDGKFEYEPGEALSFYYGDLFIGATEGDEIVTPFDLEGVGHGDDDLLALQVARLLQSLDVDGDPESGITLPADEESMERLQNYLFNDGEGRNVALNSGESDVPALVDAVSPGTETVSFADAFEHLDSTLQRLTQERGFQPVHARDLDIALHHYTFNAFDDDQCWDEMGQFETPPEPRYTDGSMVLTELEDGSVVIGGGLIPDSGPVVQINGNVPIDPTGYFSGELSDGTRFIGTWSRNQGKGSIRPLAGTEPSSPVDCSTVPLRFANPDRLRGPTMIMDRTTMRFWADGTREVQGYFDIATWDGYNTIILPAELTYTINGTETHVVESDALAGAIKLWLERMPSGTTIEYEYRIDFELGGERDTMVATGTLNEGGSGGGDEDDGSAAPGESFNFCAENYSLQHCATLASSPPVPDSPGFVYEVERREDRSTTPRSGGFCSELPEEPPLTIANYGSTSATEITLPNGVVLNPEPSDGIGSESDRTSCKICYRESGVDCGEL